jgi:hypothetical protein
MMGIPKSIYSVLVGLILFDAWMMANHNAQTARIGFKQGFINSRYFFHRGIP